MVVHSTTSFNTAFGEAHRECADLSPIMVFVPVGAEDEDEGTVTEAYKMSFPPAYAAKSDVELFHISPLTTFVWETVVAQLDKIDPVINCESLINNYEKRQKIESDLNSTIRDYTHVARGTLLGMGACLIDKNTDSWGVYVGNPAKKLQKKISYELF